MKFFEKNAMSSVDLRSRINRLQGIKLKYLEAGRKPNANLDVLKDKQTRLHSMILNTNQRLNKKIS
jgi:hypothetical protein